MRQNVAALSFALISAFFSAGCGSDHSGDPGVGPSSVVAEATRPSAQERPPLDGSLADLVRAMQQSAQLSACDTDQFQQRLEIAVALDERAAEIEAFARHRNELRQASRRRAINLGPIQVLDENSRLYFLEGWTHQYYSWREIFSAYRNLKNQPINSRWVEFNKWVQDQLSDDLARLLEGANMALRPRDEEPLSELIFALEGCVAEPGCVQPRFSRRVQAFVARVPHYQGAEQGRSAVERLLAVARNDFEQYFAFKHNPGAHRVSPTLLEVELDAGLFEPVKERVAEFLTAAWSTDSLRVGIRWVNQSDHPNAFRLVPIEGIGSRSYVTRQPREIHLGDGINQRILAHEFGHVLGFRDRYFTIWEARQCRYVVFQRSTDLMSDSHNGRVLRSDLQTLDQQYPFQL